MGDQTHGIPGRAGILNPREDRFLLRPNNIYIVNLYGFN